MSDITDAILADGTKLPFVRVSNPPRGGMKHTFFAPDKSYVVQFFNDPSVAKDHNLRDRLEAIIGKYNPTVPESKGGASGNTDQTAAYFRALYCWPTAIVESPEFGIVCPAYPPNFFFGENASIIPEMNPKGKDKSSKWFTSEKLRKYLAPDQKGDFRMMLAIATKLARAIRRMHVAGLAHSDLSSNNVLIDPSSGKSVVIDIDSLVVPNMYPPEVAGTRGYIAPEVLATMEYDRDDTRRMLPRIETDLHSLAVLIYEYLLMRHPLEGPKIHSRASSEEDDFLALGPEATFIENPADTSNRPKDLKVPIDALGPGLRNLFLRAFVDGLHNPGLRPAAQEWERELDKSFDLLQRCPNPDCPSHWFVMSDPSRDTCPFCGTKVAKKDRMQLSLKRESGRQGQWKTDRILTLYDYQPLFRWHVYKNELPNERADRHPLAWIRQLDGKWYLQNGSIPGLRTPNGAPVPSGQGFELKPGQQFRMTDQPNGRLAEVLG